MLCNTLIFFFRYDTLRSVFRKTYQEEGLKVMYRGFSPTVLGSAVYSGIGFGTYETLKKFHAGEIYLP